MDVMERLRCINDIDHAYRDLSGNGIAISRAAKATDAELIKERARLRKEHRSQYYPRWRWWEKKIA